MHQANKIQRGNAKKDSLNGWFIGEFISQDFGLRHSKELEIKWGIHKQGEKRAWSTSKQKTITILISGKIAQLFKTETGETKIILEAPGDYALYAGVPHRWEALADTTILTVRWLSTSSEAT